MHAEHDDAELMGERNFDWNYQELRHQVHLMKSANIKDPPYGIRNIFNADCSHLEIDINLLKRIHTYQLNFRNKDQDSIEFFGGGLTGVQVVRFLPSDRDRWFDEVLETSDGPLSEKLIALPTVNENWFISSDTFNLSCVWLAHVIFKSKKFTDKQKHDAMVDVFLILQYKYLTSILFHWFKYPADRAVAEATYAQLSYKFAIKTYGSWYALLEARAKEIVSEGSIHSHVLDDMRNDADVTYMLNDIQGRIKDIMKNIYRVFEAVRNSGARISSTSSVMTDHEGEEILRDKSKHLMAYTRYLNSIVYDRSSFIKEELTSVIENIVHTMPSALFLTTLNWMSDNYRQTGADEVEYVLNHVLVYTFGFISENRELIRKESDLVILLSKLKGSFMSSRSTDDELAALRTKCEEIVKKATQNRNDSVIASTRTGVLLYIVTRTFLMKHYS